MCPSLHLPSIKGGLRPAEMLLVGATNYYTAAGIARHARLPVRNREEPFWEREGDPLRTQDSALKNWAMVRNLLYRDTIKSAGGTFFNSEKCFCKLTSSRFAAAS